MDFSAKLSKEFNVRADHSKNIIALIDEGNTIPFIARYRKEMTGSCDDQVLREFSDRLTYLRNLEKRKEEVASAISEQGKWTEEIAKALLVAETMTEVEDIYRPYKQKKKTRASVAAEKGLTPLADMIYAQVTPFEKVMAEAEKYIDEEKGVKNVKEAVTGALDVIAEKISDDAALRKTLRTELFEHAEITTKLLEAENSKTYEMYADYKESVKNIPSHRTLAINRGEKEECLKVALGYDADAMISIIESQHVVANSTVPDLMKEAITDSFKRLIYPSLEREIRSDITDRANEQAIKMFEVNLRPLLLQPPLKNKRILGLDPAYRTGCKIAVIDENGNVLDTSVVYPTPPQNKVEEAKAVLKKLIAKDKVNVISIGNGTASKESEIFVADLIKECESEVAYAVVNEAGASVYSASKLGAAEFPEFDLTLRSAVSIARRLQDPLAELIKIDVKSIGVGQYQHDMPEKRLTEVLDGVVEDCVNSVGVDLNTASQSLLSFVAGLNSGIAANIVKYRKSKKFESREELKKVDKLGEKAFLQCAGFLRIQGENVLDNTGVHPEAYEAVGKMLAFLGYTDDDVKNGNLKELDQRIAKVGWKKLSEECGAGEITLQDAVTELKRPGRDIRDSLPAPVLRSDLMDLKDLKPGMELTGTVRNVIDFGVFVDIGVHQDGLVHISQISGNYIKHPSDVLKVGDVVKVKVLDVDLVKKKISLTMKTEENPNGIGGGKNLSDRERKAGHDRAADNRRADRQKQGKGELSLDEMLKNLQKKFN